MASAVPAAGRLPTVCAAGATAMSPSPPLQQVRSPGVAVRSPVPSWAWSHSQLTVSSGERTAGSAVSRRLSRAPTHVTEAVVELAEGTKSVFIRVHHKVKSHIRLVLACFLMVALGVAMGMIIEGWEFLTALYVIVQIVTTIGYGDITVQNEWMQLCMGFYVLGCLLIVANFLNLICDEVIDANIQSIRANLRKIEIGALNSVHDHEEAKQRLGTTNRALASGMLLTLAILMGTVFYRFSENCTCSYGSSQEDFGLLDCDGTSYDSCMATGGMQMTWTSSFYMSVITVTTVGFGDFSPKSRLGRGVAILWMLFGVAVTAYFIKALSDVLAREDPNIEFEGAKNINLDIFREMDKDGNGYLSKDEYALYVLVKHDLVSNEILQDIYAKYNSMDPEGTGQLTYEKLHESLRRKLPTQHESAHSDKHQQRTVLLPAAPAAEAPQPAPADPEWQPSASTLSI